MRKDKMELEEAINRLKQLIEIRKSRRICIDFDTCICGTKDIEIVLQALEDKEKTIADDAEDEITRFKKVILKDYIPKKKIEDKLDKLVKEYKEELEKNSIKAFILKCQIEILQELLKDK